MSELVTNKITPGTGSSDTVTLGDSGDTFTIPAGVTLAGSGAALTALPAANLTGTLPAISGASLTNLPIDPARNFFLDGDFTSWVLGNVTGVVHSAYTSTLMMAKKGATDNLVWDAKQTSDAPTVAESGYASTYCYHADITTAESALANDEYSSARYHVTADDFAHLHQKEMTLSFWHKHTKTGTCCVSFGNSAGDRYYVATYTQSVSDTWEKATITLTGDTSGTWLYAGTGVGMTMDFVLASGSDYHATANTWTAGFKVGVNGMADHTDSASNNFKIAQVGLYKGSSAPSSFVGESIAMVKKQVAYYFQNEAEANVAYKWAGHGGVTSSSTLACKVRYSGGPMRAIPTITSSAAGTWSASDHTTGGTVTVISFSGTDTDRTLVNITYGGGWTLGRYGYFYRNNTSTTYLYLDARH